jgi:hypothetical protein
MNAAKRVVLLLVPWLALGGLSNGEAAPEGRIVIAVPSEPTTFGAHVFSDQPTYNILLMK